MLLTVTLLALTQEHEHVTTLLEKIYNILESYLTYAKLT